MATRYESWDIFMVDLVKLANQEYDLNDLFEVKAHKSFNLVRIILDILEHSPGSWLVFVALCTFLAMGSFGFLAAIGTFLITGYGVIIAAILGGGALIALNYMYQNRQLPLAIKSVGDYYRPRYFEIQEKFSQGTSLHKKEIDSLLVNAVNHLVFKAENSPSIKTIESLQEKLKLL